MDDTLTDDCERCPVRALTRDPCWNCPRRRPRRSADPDAPGLDIPSFLRRDTGPGPYPERPRATERRDDCCGD